MLIPTSYVLNPDQFAAVSELPGPERYQHFVSRVADWQSVWGLRDAHGWVMAADDSGSSAFPVWPHPDYAAACTTGEWAGNAPTAIDIHDFVDEWLPRMAVDGILVAVFATPAMRGVMASAQQLAEYIREELSRIE